MPTKPQNPSLSRIDLPKLQDKFYVQLKAKGRSVNTLKNYRTDLECFNRYLSNGQTTIESNSFNVQSVQEYGKFLEKKYKSDNSRRRRVQALRIFFDFLVAENFFPSNPVRKIPTSPKFLDIPRPTPFASIKTLWQHVLEESQVNNSITRLIAKRNAISLVLIYGAGLKVSDLTSLKVDHLAFLNDEPSVLIVPTKRDPYTIPLPEVFTLVYRDYAEELERLKKEANIEFDKVFFNANPYRILNGGLSPRGIEIIFEDLRKKLLINLTPKSLRQACILKWLQQDYSENQIKEWMGVAPSYNLKAYKDVLSNHIYDDTFLMELYLHYKKKNYAKN